MPNLDKILTLLKSQPGRHNTIVEVRTRGSLPGLKYIAAKSALRTDINPRYVIEIRSIAALGEFIGFHSRAEIRLHAFDLLCMKEIIIHAANYETDGDFELARQALQLVY